MGIVNFSPNSAEIVVGMPPMEGGSDTSSTDTAKDPDHVFPPESLTRRSTTVVPLESLRGVIRRSDPDLSRSRIPFDRGANVISKSEGRSLSSEQPLRIGIEIPPSSSMSSTLDGFWHTGDWSMSTVNPPSIANWCISTFAVSGVPSDDHWNLTPKPSSRSP